MKKLISILILSIVLANVIGFYVYFGFRLVQVKREMQATLAQTSPELFQRIVLSVKGYDQAREGEHEIEWNGMMYDIALKNFNGQRIEILALQDGVETNLLGFASQLINCARSDNKIPSSIFIQFFGLTFTAPFVHEFGFTNRSRTIAHHTLYPFTDSSEHFGTISPPPKA